MTDPFVQSRVWAPTARRARWALSGHGIEWAPFDGTPRQAVLAMTAGGAKDRIAAQVRLLLLVADSLDDDRESGPPMTAA